MSNGFSVNNSFSINEAPKQKDGLFHYLYDLQHFFSLETPGLKHRAHRIWEAQSLCSSQILQSSILKNSFSLTTVYESKHSKQNLCIGNKSAAIYLIFIVLFYFIDNFHTEFCGDCNFSLFTFIVDNVILLCR